MENQGEEKLSKAQEVKRQQMELNMRKQAERDLADYKKRLKLSNEMKELQNEEIRLNIEHYKLKEDWLNNYYPKMDALEKKEEEVMELEAQKQAKAQQEYEAALKKDKESDIVIAKQGQSRDK